MEIRQEGSRLLGTHQPAAVARVSAAGSEFAAANLYKDYKFPIHPGALKYFKDKNIAAKAFQ